MRNWPSTRSLAGRAILGSRPKWIHVFRIYWVLCMGFSVQSIHLNLMSIEQQKCIATSRATLPYSDILLSPWNTSLKVKQGFYDCVSCGFRRRSTKLKIQLKWLQHAYVIISSFVNSQKLFKQGTNPNRCLNVSSLCFWVYQLCILHAVSPWSLILAPVILCCIKIRSHFLVLQDIQVACGTYMHCHARQIFFLVVFFSVIAVLLAAMFIFTNKQYL